MYLQNNNNAVDKAACKEAEAISRLKELTNNNHHGRPRRQDFRRGLEVLAGRQDFNALSRGN